MARHLKNHIHSVVLVTLAVYLGLFPSVYATFFLRAGVPRGFEGPLPEDSDVLYGFSGLEPVSFEGEAVYRLEGWAFHASNPISPGDFKKQIVLIGFAQDPLVLDAETLTRGDITEAFPDLARDLDQSGFRVYISALGLPVGRFRLGVLYTHRGSPRIFRLTNKYVLRTPNTMRLHDVQEGRPSFLVDELPTESELYYGVDQFSGMVVGGEKVAVLDGWAFFPGSTTVPDRAIRHVVLISEGALPCLLDLETIRRPDVTQAFQHMGRELGQAGFRAYVSEASLQPGLYRIGFLQTETDGRQTYGVTDRYIQRSPTGIALRSSAYSSRGSRSQIFAGLRPLAWRALLAIDPSASLLLKLIRAKAY